MTPPDPDRRNVVSLSGILYGTEEALTNAIVPVGPETFERVVGRGGGGGGQPAPVAPPEEEEEDPIAALIRQLLIHFGEDPTRPGLRDTPARVARWWREFFNPEAVAATTFDTFRADQMVVVSGLRIWSLCEHHLLPFWCDVAIGYIPGRQILGLSKFARLARLAGQRLQVQERLVEDIARLIMGSTGSADVAVYASGEHLCMVMRGAKMDGVMSSSSLHGAFRHAEVRAEFLSIVQHASRHHR